MSVALQTVKNTLAYDRFWRWLEDHPNCILEAGTEDCFLYDDDDLHWQLGADEDGNRFVQLVHGKQLVGELLIDPPVLFVQARPDATADEPDRFLFELIGGTSEEPYPLCHFLVAHGIEEDGAHPGLSLKH